MRRWLFLCLLGFASYGWGDSGFLSTSGSKIIDGQQREVQLVGINWFGFETETKVVHGLWERSYQDYLAQVKSLGFNFLRLPFSNDILRKGAKPSSIDYSKNKDLKGLTSIEVLDRVIAHAAKLGLKVMLDRHRPDSSGMTALWYNDKVSEKMWLEDWVTLAKRYRNQPAVVAFDLHNEPHGAATWGSGEVTTDWKLAAEKAGNAIHAIHPDLLIVVGGIETSSEGSYWWGGNHTQTKGALGQLKVPHKLVYTAHDYPASVYQQEWFKAQEFPVNLPAIWDKFWGYLAKEDLAPVLLGEFGSKLETPADRVWLESLTTYLKANRLSFAFWSLNPNSGDTGGLLQLDWKTVDKVKLNFILKARP